jgi:hypothetical protein
MRDILSAALAPVLFFAGFGGTAAVIALGWWIVFGTYSRMDPRNPSSFWLVVATRYKRHLIAWFALAVISVTASILLEIVGKHLR